MYVSYENREFIIKILNSIAFIVILAGIFTNLLDFGLGLVIAMALWMTASILRTWMKIDSSSQENHFQNTQAFSKILYYLGILVVIDSIFTNNLSFSLALFIAVVLFVTASIFETEESKERRKARKRNRKQRISPSDISFRKVSKPNQTQYKVMDEGPYKYSCSSCGSSVLKEDVFCQNCGGKIVFTD